MTQASIVDLHNHLLPCVDDGSRSTAESLEYLETWARQGVAAITFTPHLVLYELSTDNDIDARLNALSDAFEAFLYRTSGRTDIPALALGQEVCARNAEEMTRVASNPRVGLGGTDYVLVELGFSPGYDAAGVIEAARAAGRRIVLAHPERYAFGLGVSPVDEVLRWRDAGALIQVNGGSLQGRYTTMATEIAGQLLREDAIAIISSDHHGRSRPHDPVDAFEALATSIGTERTNELMSVRTSRIRTGAPVTEPAEMDERVRASGPGHATRVA